MVSCKILVCEYEPMYDVLSPSQQRVLTCLILLVLTRGLVFAAFSPVLSEFSRLYWTVCKSVKASKC